MRRSGILGIHAEKPMAADMGRSKIPVSGVCRSRCGHCVLPSEAVCGAVCKGKEIAKLGAIGELRRFEGNCPNMFDWGTHWFDMFFFYNDDEPAEWVIGQIDAEGGARFLGRPWKGSGDFVDSVLQWARGLLATGGTGMQGVQNRLIGSEGVIEIGGRNQPPLRVVSGVQQVDVDLRGHGESARCDDSGGAGLGRWP